MRFLLLRPQAKCNKSAKAFNHAGISTLACGLIDTVLDQQAIDQLPAKIQGLHQGNRADIYVIVTSTVAAQQCVLLKEYWPEDITFFAVGASTGDILQQAGIEVIIPNEARTEGLLALSELLNMHNKTAIIIKGYGGRELLNHTLVTRGAKVEEWEVYKRIKITHPSFTQDWQGEPIHCIIATSGEVINAAFDYFESSWLKQLNWIVVSQRTAEIASTLGITKIDISRDASDQALIQCAQQLMTRARHSSEH